MQLADRHLLGTACGDAFSRVGQQRGEGGEGALRLGDRSHLEPVAEQHDGDQGGQLPPDLDLEEAKGAGPRGDERDHDGEGDEGHHPGLAVGQFPLSTTKEDHPAVEEDDGADDGRDVFDAGKRRDRVAEPVLDVLAQHDDRDRQGEAEPELVPEHRHRMAGVLVVAAGMCAFMKVLRVRGHRARRLLEMLRPLCHLVFVVLVVIHSAIDRLLYSRGVS